MATVCSVAPGDVVNILVRGDNNVEKQRYCVIMERVPPGMPSFVLAMFCCEKTKFRASPNEVFRIDGNATIKTMNLDFSSSFHQEDVVAAAGTSPNLKKIGWTPRNEMEQLKRMYQVWKAQKRMPKFSPERQPATILASVAKHLGVPE